MKNQKAATALPPQSHFAAAQTSEGGALFFSIGDEGVFYLIHPQVGERTGWAVTSLSADFAALHGGRAITAKTFDVAQDPSTGAISVAVAIRDAAGSADTLYVLAGLSDAPGADWMASSSARPWVARRWDDAAHPQLALDLAYLFLAPDAAGSPLVAGVRQPDTSYIQNYTVSLTAPAGAWKVLQTAENYTAMMDRGIGRVGGVRWDGLYELYTLSGETALMFTPLGSLFGPPTVTKLAPPVGASALATGPGAGGTDLYVAGADGLYRWSPGDQTPFAPGTRVVASTLFAGATSLRAHATATEVVVWGLNAQGQVFQTRCATGSVAASASWSAPVPIETGVEQFASFVNLSTGASELFAHTQGQTIVHLAQDPVTTLWRKQDILLPSPNPAKMVQFNAYTTQITATDGNGLPAGEVSLRLSSTSPVGVWVNHEYVRLSSTPVQVCTDPDGTLTIVQQTESLSAVAYFVQADEGFRQSVNPMSGPLDKLATITDGASLRAVRVSDGKGGERPLVPASIPADHSDAVARSLAQFVQIAGTLPQDGSVRTTQRAAFMTAAAVPQATSHEWGVVLGDEGAHYWERSAPVPAVRAPVSLALAARASSPGVLGAIQTVAGDVIRWITQAASDVKQFFVRVAEGIATVFVEVAGVVYRFVVETIGALVGAVEWMFNRIKVLAEDLVNWLGFLFEWGDIVRTHNVIRTLLRGYLTQAGEVLATAETDVKAAFGELEKGINAWAGISDNTEPIGTYQARTTALPGQDSPQANWALYHLKGNMDRVSTAGTPAVQPQGAQTAPDNLLAILENAASAFGTAADQIRTQIVDQWHSLTPIEVMKRLVAILGNLVLTETEHLILASLELLRAMMAGMLEVLDAPISIPVLSPLYKEISGNDLSILDLASLVGAVPVTVIFKLVTNRAPYPDTPETAALIAAPDLRSFLARIGVADAPGVTGGTPAVDFGGVHGMMATPPEAASTAGPAAGTAITQHATMLAVVNILATVGTPVVIVTNLLKPKASGAATGASEIENIPAPASRGVRICAFVGYLLYVAPNIPSFTITELAGLNRAMTVLGIAKAGLDNLDLRRSVGNGAAGFDVFGGRTRDNSLYESWAVFSPFFECIISMMRLGPVIATFANAEEHTTIGVASLIGNLALNVSGILAPTARSVPGAIVVNGLAALYGTASLVIAITAITE